MGSKFFFYFSRNTLIKTFKINQTKKIFDQKNFQKLSFFGHFLLKMKVFGHFRIFLGRNQKNVFSKPFAQFYYGHFKPSPRSLPLKMCKRVNFVRFRTKLDLPAPVTRTGGSKGKNSLVPLTSFVPVFHKF